MYSQLYGTQFLILKYKTKYNAMMRNNRLGLLASEQVS